MSIILGIDPGTAITGYGVVAADTEPLQPLAWGALRTGSAHPDPERLLTVFQGMRELIATHAPDVLAVEKLFFNRNVTTALAVGQARGVAILAAAEVGIPVAEFTPAEVKQAVTGHGRADKDQVGYMIRALLRLDEVPRPDDVADALAVAVCCAHMGATRERWSAQGVGR